jgi:acyl carrier protein
MEQNLLIKDRKTLRTKKEIQDWIVAYLADLLEIEAKEVKITIPFDRYGLNSAAAVGLMGDLENWLGNELDPTLLYDYPSVKALAEHLSQH